MGLFCCFPFYNNFSAVVFITLKVILLRVAMLAMLNIMIRAGCIELEECIANNSKEIVLISNYEQQNYYNFSI